jgi:hypothetical protein
LSLTTQIYVALVDEGVDVWRPVRAAPVGNGVYLIVDQPYDRDIETWEFEPGDRVVCEEIDSSEGVILAAIKRATPDDAP